MEGNEMSTESYAPSQTVEEIARGYVVAALWTNGVDDMSGEYRPDEDKVESLMPYGREAARAFMEVAGTDWYGMAGDEERIGNCLHYDREGHGTGFEDEADAYARTADDPEPADYKALADAARSLGEDDALADAILPYT